ncbi:MAG: hypothetical protein JF610_11720 [Acidobacteria bacterium]|nr:hypothetical protein [Acidobacteriota bacterium]
MLNRNATSSASAMAAFSASLVSADAATAAWALVQNRHSFSHDTKAANNTRSPTLHSDGPRITAYV